MRPYLEGGRPGRRIRVSRALALLQTRFLCASSIVLFLCLFFPGPTAARSDPVDPIQSLIERLNQTDPSEQWNAALELAKLNDPRVVRGLVTTLKSSDPTARKYAALALGEIKDPRSIEALRQALGDKNKYVFAEVRAALLGFRKTAEPILTDALNDKNPRIRWRAAEILGFIGSNAGTKNLFEAVEKGSPHERIEALKVLARFHEKKALDPLTAALVDKEKDVVKGAEKALGDWVSSDRSIIPPLLSCLKSTKNPDLKIALIGVLKGKPSAFDTFMDLSKEDDIRVRRSALGALAVSGRKDVVPVLLKAMEDNDPAIKQSAVFGLGELRADEAIDPLIRYLREKESEDGIYALNALVKIGPKAIPKVSLLLRDKDERIRCQAARILGGIGDPVVLESLKALLKDPSINMRKTSIRSLGRLGDARVSALLIEALKDEDEGIREAARFALADMGEKAIGPLLNAFKGGPGFDAEEVSSILVQMGPGATGELKRLWKTGTTQQRLVVLSAIAELSDEESLKILAAALNTTENERIRMEAARLLVPFGNDATNLLLKALKDPSLKVRKITVESLGEIGDRDAVVPLVSRLEKDSLEVRRSTIVALGKIGDEKAIPALVRSLNDKDVTIRSLAAEALGEIGNPKAARNLIKLLSDPEERVSAAAVKALGDLEDHSATESLVSLLSSREDKVRRLTVEALGQWGDLSAVVPLVTLLKSCSEEDRQSVLLSLTYILQRTKRGEVALTAGQIETLIDLLGSPDEPTRIRVSLILESLGSQAVPPLMRIVKSEEKKTRVAAIRTLGAIGDRKATPLLLEVLRDEKDPAVQEGVLISLGWIGDPKALTPIIKKLHSEEWPIRAAASFALGKIGDTRAVAGLMTLMNDDVEKVRKNVGSALEAIVGESCPLVIALTPFKNADLVLFVLMIGLVATPTLRSWISPVDLIIRKSGRILEIFSNQRVKWWIAFFSGIVALAVFVYCVYCEIFQPATEAPSQEFLTNLYLFALKVFPFFVGGCLIAGIMFKYLSKKSRLPTSMFGACVLGALLPICSCGVVPLGRAMKSMNIPIRTVIAFLVVTPILNPFVIFLSHGVIGLQYTLLRIAGTFAIAILMGIIVERVIGTEETDESSKICQFCKSCASPTSEDSNSGLLNGWRLMGLLHRYIIIGTILGAVMATYMPMSIITKYLGSDILGLVFAVTIGIPLYLCSGEEVIMLKPLLDLGLPMGHAIAFTVAANGICITSIAVLMGAMGRKTTIMMVVLFWVLSFGLGYLINIAF